MFKFKRPTGGSRNPITRLVPKRVPGTSRFKIQVLQIDPDTLEPVKRKKSKKERRRIRKLHEKTKVPKVRDEKPEMGRALRYLGNRVKK